MLVKLSIVSKNGFELPQDGFFESTKILDIFETADGKMGFSYPTRGNKDAEVLADFIVSESVSDYEALTNASTLAPGRVRQAQFIFNATGGKAIGTHNLVDLAGNPAELPNTAVITRTWVDVQTTFTSATDAATIALGVATQSAAGFKAAVAISNGANPWDAGQKDLLQTGAAANFIKLTADRLVNAVVAVEALTAGKLVLNVEYTVVADV